MQPAARLLAASVVTLLVALGVLVVAPGPASAESGDTADPETVTTTLHPGWNMVGWLGPEAPATDLFEAIPALKRVYAWDPEHQRYQSRTRTSVPPDGLRDVEPGMGLWLVLDGDEPFEWIRPVDPGGVLVSLRTGRNLVGWAGSDGIEIGEALARFGDSVVAASQWDAESEGYDHYRPGSAHPRNRLVELGRGDGLWVELTTDARWWQSGARGVEFTFPDSAPDEHQAAVRAGTESVIAFFAERYEVAAPELSVVVDPNLTIGAGALDREILIGPALFARPDVAGTVAHEYFHVLQGLLATDGLRSAKPYSPGWMTEGTASYAAALYWQEQSGQSASEQRHSQLRHSTNVTASLNELESPGAFYETGPDGYNLAVLAVGWLAGYAVTGSTDDFDPLAPDWPDSFSDGGAYVAYYHALASAADWEEAFVESFGLSPATFYESFEEYRLALAAHFYPHLADDTQEPVLVFVGDVPTAAKSSVRTTLENIQTFYAERFGVEAGDYTVYVGADEDSAAEAHRRAFGEAPVEPFCRRAGTRVAATLVFDLACYPDAPHGLGPYHLSFIRERLAPRLALPPADDGLHGGPMWLILAIEAYALQAYADASGRQSLDSTLNEQVRTVRRVAQPLASLTTWDEVTAAGYWDARALSFLAGEWLARHSREPALLDFYRQLPLSMSWQEAFETAFGTSVEEFYEEFESYRAEVAPLWPYRIRGVVVDPAGNPSSGAWIAANGGEGRWADTATTGRDGSFELIVGDGGYSLEVDLTSTGCAVSVDHRMHSAAMIEVDGADVTGVEVRLPEGSSCAES